MLNIKVEREMAMYIEMQMHGWQLSSIFNNIKQQIKNEVAFFKLVPREFNISNDSTENLNKAVEKLEEAINNIDEAYLTVADIPIGGPKGHGK